MECCTLYQGVMALKDDTQAAPPPPRFDFGFGGRNLLSEGVKEDMGGPVLFSVVSASCPFCRTQAYRSLELIVKSR